MTLNNLLAWWLLVAIVAGAGALLPLAFRLRQARTRLWYWHAMLIACLAIPLVEPWARPTPVRSANTFTTGAFRVVNAAPDSGFSMSWPFAIAIVLTAG